MVQQPPDAFIVSVIREPTPETTVADIVVGALGLTGVLFLIALVLGGAFALLLVLWHKRRRPEDDHLPPVSPVTAGSSRPRSSPAP
jgi:hypothetical protein